jgi:RND family efflux transporter MFP subunit
MSKAGSIKKTVVYVLLCLVIISTAVVFTILLVKLKKPPERAEQKWLAPLVKVEQLHTRDIQMVVSGFGTVRAKVEIEIAPQIFGNVVWINQQFRKGGFIPAGEVLLEIDPRDYELAVQQAQAAVAEAQVLLDLEKAEAKVVQNEWEQLYPGTKPDSPLVLREPQIRQAQARLESAKAALRTAELNLERTKLTLPLDIRIVSESVDLGQFVTTGRFVGQAYGIEAVEIDLPLEDKELAWFDIPENPASINGQNSSTKVATAKVKVDFAGREHIWEGRVVRTTGEVDKTSRLVSVVVEVNRPFERSDSRPPLFPGVFVEVLIEGRVLKDAIAIPRDAIHSGNEVWVVRDNRLHIQQLEIVRADRDFAYVVSVLLDGDKIVVSSLDVVTEGMEVRTEPGRTGVD